MPQFFDGHFSTFKSRLIFEQLLKKIPLPPQMPEEEAFCVLVRLMQEYRMREMFKPSMAELGLCMYQLEMLVQEHVPGQSVLGLKNNNCKLLERLA